MAMPTPVTRRYAAEEPTVVFAFFTLLYRPNTVLSASGIQHKSPVIWELRKVFS
jgi:hypothetical protein